MNRFLVAKCNKVLQPEVVKFCYGEAGSGERTYSTRFA